MTTIPPDVDEARLTEICQQRWSESQTLDFKRELPAPGNDADKRELLKDVCAMANADGGDLVYGVEEASGAADKIVPIAGEPADAAKRRLGQIIDAGIEPRVAGLRFQDVPVIGGYALLVRVPASFDGPHCYKTNEARRFVMRNGTYIQDMTYPQLRAAFDRTATLAERARDFRERRLGVIRTRKTWRRLIAGPIVAVHFIPIAGMAGNRSIDIAALYNNYATFMFDSWGGASRTTNLDGLVVHPGIREGQTEIGAYTQVFRNGSFETARYGGGFADLSRKVIPAAPISGFVRDAIDRFLKAARNLGFSGPSVAAAAVLTVGDYEFGMPEEFFDSRRVADRADIVMPEVWIEAIESAAVDDAARPILDVLWQAFDVGRCYLFDQSGRWKTPR